jgi:hypothetical protein
MGKIIWHKVNNKVLCTFGHIAAYASMVSARFHDPVLTMFYYSV